MAGKLIKFRMKSSTENVMIIQKNKEIYTLKFFHFYI